jgi:hypothetical protein
VTVAPDATDPTTAIMRCPDATPAGLVTTVVELDELAAVVCLLTYAMGTPRPPSQ